MSRGLKDVKFTFPKVCCPEGKLTSREQENSRGSISAPQITPLRMRRGIDVCAEVEDRRRCGLNKNREHSIMLPFLPGETEEENEKTHTEKGDGILSRLRELPLTRWAVIGRRSCCCC